jgi:hypothetical protein
MSFQEFNDKCPGCRPAILDVKTGQVLPDDDPIMVKMLSVWKATTLGERQIYHRVTCLNSRDPLDLFIVQSIIERFQSSLLKEADQ